jgi:hypothetical protein
MAMMSRNSGSIAPHAGSGATLTLKPQMRQRALAAGPSVNFRHVGKQGSPWQCGQLLSDGI